MQTAAVQTAVNTMRPVPVPAPLMEVIRAHGMNELSHADPVILRRYQTVLTERIASHEAMLLTNLQNGYKTELRKDLRFFQSIQDAISALLTGEFNAK